MPSPYAGDAAELLTAQPPSDLPTGAKPTHKQNTPKSTPRQAAAAAAAAADHNSVAAT